MSSKKNKRRTRFRSIPIIALASSTALTAFITWAITFISDSTADELKDTISVTVESDPTRTAAFSNEEQETVLPERNLIAPDPGAGCKDLYARSRTMGGVDARESRIHVFVRRETPGTAVISQMFVVIDERAPIRLGSHLYCGLEGELDNRRLSVDLDTTQPRIKYENDQGNAFGFTLSEGEAEAFTIRAVTNHSYIRWHLELEVVEGTEKRTVRVDDAGVPFATSATTEEAWGWNGQSWSATSPDGKIARTIPGDRFSDDS
jgi:hypothetical protein